MQSTFEMVFKYVANDEVRSVVRYIKADTMEVALAAAHLLEYSDSVPSGGKIASITDLGYCATMPFDVYGTCVHCKRLVEHERIRLCAVCLPHETVGL